MGENRNYKLGYGAVNDLTHSRQNVDSGARVAIQVTQFDD